MSSEGKKGTLSSFSPKKGLLVIEKDNNEPLLIDNLYGPTSSNTNYGHEDIIDLDSDEEEVTCRDVDKVLPETPCIWTSTSNRGSW